SIIKTAYITINTPANPVTTGASRCGTGSVNLAASGTSQLYWYTSPTGTGTPVFIGTNYSTPSLSTTTSYYVVNTSTNTPVFGAPTSTNIGAGANFNTNTAYEIFDVLQPCTLRTAVMYASTAGNRTIELRNSANAVITSTIVNLAIGANTVNINFALTPGTGYRLGLSSTSAVNLYRNSAGAVYPYNIGGLVSITGSSAGTPGYFYFYYNWQVQKAPCTSAPVAVTATISAGPSLTVNTPTICSGQSVNLTASGATTYSWSSGQTTSAINVTPSSTTNYTVYGTSSSCTNSLSTSVVVNPTPTVTVNSATICAGQNAVLTANGASAYSWSSGPSTQSISVSPTSNTTYTVTGLSGSCTGSALSSVIVNALPSVSLAATSSTACTSTTGGIPVTLTGTPAGGVYSGTGVSGNTFNTQAAAGTYTAVYSYTNSTTGCSNSTSTNIVVNVCTGIELLNGLTEKLTVYPNPATEYFVLNGNISGESLTVNIYDVTGKIIISHSTSSNQEIIDISELAKGTYFVEVLSQQQRVYKTNIVKQ
ncbi:MAG TPA: T9SS type A sorting domain-containing protein, partial [Bacteroidia bacterium]|nr:T9SS type A sorting domain-containing protein [Bacteroidia bacterium]